MALIAYSLFFAALALSTLMTVQRRWPWPWWKVPCWSAWLALAGILAFNIAGSEVDAEGIVHEQFGLAAISFIVGTQATLLTALFAVLSAVRAARAALKSRASGSSAAQ